jgi:porin
MKYFIKITLVFFIILSSQNTIAQTDTLQKKSALSFEATYIGDAVNNFSGGIKKGNAYLGMANIRISLNTKDAGLWKGGELFINGANTHGGSPSANLSGDFQIASNLEAGNLTYLHEFYYRQNTANITIIAGLQDLCAEFLSSENAGLFLNSSFGIHSSISSNMPVPIFPLTSLGIQIHYYFSEKITAKIALFDGLPDDFEINPHNISWRLSGDDGYMFFSEINLNNLIKNSTASYKIGYYYHNSHKIAISSENRSVSMPENYGVYLVMDHLVFKKENGQQLSVFSQISLCPDSKNNNWYYAGLGCNCKGLIKKRTNDIFGFAIAHAGFKNKNYSHETTIETEYKAQINDNLFIQPGCQYIINPSRTDDKLNNAFLATLRVGINI